MSADPTSAWCSRCLWCRGHVDHTDIGTDDAVHHRPPAAADACATCGCAAPPDA